MNNRKITIYGLSADPTKPSHYVPVYLRKQGWDILGIYPKSHSESDFKIYSNLNEVPDEFKNFLVVFRSSDKIPDLVDEVLEFPQVKILWLQLGIENPRAEKLAESKGLQVVSNKCLKIEHKKWF